MKSYNFRLHYVFRAVGVAVIAIAMLPSLCHAAPPKDYSLVWKDEFNGKPGSPPDPTFWDHETGASGWGNNELQNYVSDQAHSHIVVDADAGDKRALQITATSDGKGHYESERLITGHKFSFQYGYVEARIRLPAGQGIWSAFWMLGTAVFDSKVGWPKCGEVDIMENIGKTEWLGKNRSSLHGPGYSGGDSLHGDINLKAGTEFKDSYHLFGMLWSKDSMAFSVDGRVFFTQKSTDTHGRPWVFNQPCFFIANIAIGGNFSGSPDATTKFPQMMRIDYIRLYQKPGSGSILNKPKRK